ncbi:Chorismate synthase [Bienertia sinuspersici]
MASTSTKQGSPRRLSDLLDEQQEPFVLEIYLLEKGYQIKKSLGLDSTNIGCCSTKHDHYNTNKSIPNMAKALLNKLVSRMKQRKRKNEVVGSTSSRCCSSVSCLTKMSNASHHDESNQWKIIEENTQYSPDSVLEEIDLLQAIPVYNVKQSEEHNNPAESGKRFQKKVSEDAILSASLWELLVHFRSEKPKLLRRRKPFPEYMNSKKVLQKDRQLLFNCVREAVENGKQLKGSINNREKGLKIGPEETGKFICKKLKALGKLSADETDIQKVLRRDLFEKGVADEWSGFNVWKKEIAADIGDGIVDEITDEIVCDMSYQ